MADFVDNFFGNSFDDPKSQAVMALASGLMGGDWRKGVNGYLGAMGTAGEYNSKKQLQQAQMQEMMVKAAAEKQKMEMDAKKNKMLMDMLGGGQPSQASSSGLLGDSAPQGGLLGGGSQGGGDPFAGVDKRALMLDYLQNGGKNMGEWVNARTRPDMQVTNGYAYDKNRLGAGFMPFLNTDASGKTSMGQIGANGLPVVTAPSGALETFGAYRAIDEQAKAGSDVQQVYNKENGTMEFRTRAQIANAAQAGAPKQMPQAAPANGSNSGYWGGSKESGLASRLEVLQSEINNPKTTPANRAAAQRELTQTQIDLQRIRPTQGAQSGAFAAAPSALETAKAKAQETAMVEQAKADVMSTQGRMSAINSANDAIAVVDKALTHPGLGTATGLSGTIDPRNYIPGTNAKDFRAVHDQLAGKAFLTAFESLKGGGAISEKEGEKAQQAIARMSLTQSEKEYKQALNDYKEVIQKGAARLKNNEPVQEKQARVIDALPTANNGNKGQRIRDTSTGKILKSNGISWVAE